MYCLKQLFRLRFHNTETHHLPQFADDLNNQWQCQTLQDDHGRNLISISASAKSCALPIRNWPQHSITESTTRLLNGWQYLGLLIDNKTNHAVAKATKILNLHHSSKTAKSTKRFQLWSGRPCVVTPQTRKCSKASSSMDWSKMEQSCWNKSYDNCSIHAARPWTT